MTGTADAERLLAECIVGDEAATDATDSNPIIDFAQKYVRLPNGEPFSLTPTPALRGVYDALADPSVAAKVVAICKGVQLALTTTACNTILYNIYRRKSVLFLLEDENKVQKICESRITPAFNRPPLREMLARERNVGARGASFRLSYQGGHFSVGGSNSPSSYTSLDCNLVVADEFAQWKSDVGPEMKSRGDPLSLLRDRTAGKGTDSKIFILSTPLHPHDLPGSFVNILEQGHKATYQMPCPHCGGFMNWTDETFIWEVKDSRISCGHRCPHCNKKQLEQHKTGMMADSRAHWKGTNERSSESDVLSFSLPSFYSPTSWKTWLTIAKQAVRAEKNNASLQVLYNSEYAKPYSPSIQPPEADEVAEKWTLKDCARGIVPDWISFLTAGVDVQKDYLSVSIYGWSVNGHSFLVQTDEIADSIDNRNAQNNLRRLLYRRWPCAGGGSLPVLLAAIDAGFNNVAVKMYTSMFHQPSKPSGSSVIWTIGHAPSIIPMRGDWRQEQNGIVSRVSPPFLISKTGGRPIRMIYAGGNLIKHDLYESLNRDADYDPADIIGTAHERSHFFPRGIPPGVIDEIVAEEMVTEVRLGTNQAKYRFVLRHPSAENHKLDAYVYARTCAEMLGVSALKQAGFDRLRRRHWKAGKAAEQSDERLPSFLPTVRKKLEPARKKI